MSVLSRTSALAAAPVSRRSSARLLTALGLLAIAAPGSAQVLVRQGGNQYSIQPVQGAQTVVQLYSYNVPNNSSASIGVEVLDTSVLFLYQQTTGTQPLSLVAVHDIAPMSSNGTGGTAQFMLSGLPVGAIYGVEDDPGGDTFSPIAGGVTNASWQWQDCCTDGLAITGLEADPWCIAVDPTFASGISGWEVLSGPGLGGPRSPLNLTFTTYLCKDCLTLTCPTQVDAECDGSGMAQVTVQAQGSSLCGASAIQNDRTAGGPDASGTYLLGTTQVTFTLTDAVGFTTTCQTDVVVTDTLLPVLTGVPPDADVSCDNVPPPANVTVSDICDPAPSLTFTETRTDGPCLDTYTLTRTWTARDASGNTVSATQIVNVSDTTPPQLQNVPAGVTVECSAVPPPANVTATDNCDPAPAVSFSEVRTDGSCPDSYTLTRTWTAVDRCGNQASGTQVVTVRDTTPPTLQNVPAGVTVECSAVPPPATNVTATDNCDPAPAVSFSEVRTNGSCPDSYTLTRTWTAVDRCGNQASGTQVVTVRDTTPPQLQNVPAGVTVECSAVPPVPTNVTATDNCDPAPTVSFGESRTNGPCQDTYTLTRTWTARDRCGNTTPVSQTITVRDTTPPQLQNVPPSVTVECSAVPPPPTNVTATDNCDPAPTVSFGESRTNGPCLDTYTLTRTWTARDRCGNTTTASQTIAVRDTTPPLLLNVPASTTASCEAVPPPPNNVTATDNCDPAPTVSFGETRTNGSCQGNYVLTRTWTATDRCGNATTATRTVTVRDLTPPVVQGGNANLHCTWPPNHKYVCFTKADFRAQVSDACSDPVTWQFAGCASDQCDDAPCPGHPGENGDGSTTNDCVVSPAGDGFCVRSERAGTNPGGRHYGVSIVATDGCGNASPAVVLGHIYVPHDQSPRLKCRKP